MEKVLRVEISRIASMMPLPDLLIPGIRNIPAVKYVVKERVKKGEYNALLFKAVKTGMIRIVKYLLDAGADTEVRSKMCGSTVLHFAAAGGHTEIVKMLLDAGAEKNVINNYEDTPKSLASEFNHMDTLAVLLK